MWLFPSREFAVAVGSAMGALPSLVALEALGAAEAARREAAGLSQGRTHGLSDVEAGRSTV